MIRVAVLTISDSAAQGKRQDVSGPALLARCRENGWHVAAHESVADEESHIASLLRDWADQETASLILTTGGTGVAARDVTPEATRNVIDREIPGLTELMRARGLAQTELSILSRAVAGTRNKSLIVNLPGSPRGAVFSLGVIEHLVSHIIDLLEGRTEHVQRCHAKAPIPLETQEADEASHQ